MAGKNGIWKVMNERREVSEKFSKSCRIKAVGLGVKICEGTYGSFN